MKFVIYLCVIITNSAFSQEYEWDKVTDHCAFSPRDSSPNAVVIFKNKYWVLGGWRFDGREWKSYTDVWSSDDGITWDSINLSPPYSHYSSFVMFNKKIWAFSERTFYSENGKNWSEVKTSQPMGVHNRVVVFKKKLWYHKNRLLMSSSDGINWTKEGEAPWANREEVAFKVFKNRLYMMGGSIDYNTGRDYYYNDVWVSDNGKDWKELVKHAAWPGRYWFSLVPFDKKLWLLGGWDYHQQNNLEFGNLNDIWVSKDAINWTQEKFDTQWSHRHAMLSWADKRGLWISSGYGHGGTKRLYNDVWILRKDKSKEKKSYD